MKFKQIISFTLMCFLFTGCSSHSENNRSEFHNSVCIGLNTDNNIKITSENPLKIKRGEDAKFSFELKDSYDVCDIDYGKIDKIKNEIIISNVQYSKNYELTSYESLGFILDIINDENKGTVSVSPNKKHFEFGESVTIKVVPISNNLFMNYTNNFPYRSDDFWEKTSLALSFDNTFTFKILKDMKIYCNYLDSNLLNIKYYGNGGTTSGGNDSILLDYKINYPHKNPVTLMGGFYFDNPGYVLTSWNTKKDGTGERVGLGSKINSKYINEGLISLYATWEKSIDESLFETIDTSDNECAITNYIGDKQISTFCMPETINNKKVIGVKSNAINLITSEKIILPKTIKFLEKNSFLNCQNAKNLILYSSINEIYDESFVPNKLNKIYINANSYTDSYIGAARDLTYQIDNINSFKKKKMLFLGTSSTRWNQVCGPLEERSKEFNYYICGSQGACDDNFINSLFIPYIYENDVVCLSMDERNAIEKSDHYFNMVYIFSNLDLLKNIDYQEFRHMFFPMMMNFSKEYYHDINLGLNSFTAEKGYPWILEHGGFPDGKQTDDIDNVDKSYQFNFKYYMDSTMFDYIECLVTKMKEKCNSLYLMWGSYNKNAFTDDIIKDAELYSSFLLNRFSEIEFVNSLKDNIYPGNYFIKNDNIHLSLIGTEYRAKQWASSKIFN